MKLACMLWGALALAGCGPAGYATDKGWCDAACSTLLACGVQGIGDEPTCSANCQTSAAATFLACVKAGNPGDCNSMSTCIIKQTCNLVPNGSNSCQLTATCELNCPAGDVACGCACVSALQPAKARNIIINNNCVLFNCQGCTNATTCGICIQGRCSQQAQQCQNS
jgi:hypothetical protein